MKVPHRPLVAIPDPDPETATLSRRRDQVLPLTVAAFCLGVVVAASGFLGLSAGDGDQVPASLVQDKVAQLTASQAVVSAQRERIAAQLGALADAETLQRRLVAALDNPVALTAEQVKALRTTTEKVTRLIERIRVVTVAAPTPTTAPSRRPVPAARARPRPTPEPAATRTPAATPAPAPGCRNAILGVCLLP